VLFLAVLDSSGMQMSEGDENDSTNGAKVFY